jgi:hypothetical protein
MSNVSLSSTADTGQGAVSRDWMLAMLKELMLGMMAADLPILTKANALARLGNLYLKTDNAAELKRVNAAVVAQLSEMGERVATLEAERATGGGEVTAPSRHEGNGSPPPKRSPSESPAQPADQNPLRSSGCGPAGVSPTAAWVDGPTPTVQPEEITAVRANASSERTPACAPT